MGASGEIVRLANVLRSKRTEPEILLWERLKGNQLGVKFRQQHPFSIYILDFYCHELGLSIELDGLIHLKSDQLEKDRNRTEHLEDLGVFEIRILNEEIYNSTDQVLERIKLVITQRKSELRRN